MSLHRLRLGMRKKEVNVGDFHVCFAVKMSHIRAYLLIIAAYSSVFRGISLTLVGRPLNTAVIQGSAVTLQCRSNVSGSVIQWYNSTCVTTARSVVRCRDDLIYSGYLLASNVSQRFSVTVGYNGTHVTRDLNISPTQLTDAGVYLCLERRPGVTDSSSAQLIVLAGNTRCTTNVSASGAVQENDVITMTCSITYRGNLAPVMRWFNSVTRHNFTDDNITLTTSNMTVTSQLTVTASADLHDSQIVCVTYFTQPPTTLRRTTATNIPSYTDIWTSPTFSVIRRYAPKNLQIVLSPQSTYQPADRIQCSAEGSPEPSYQWTDLVSGTVIQGAVLIITKDTVGRNHTFRCTASNKYNSISSTLQFTVEVASSDAYKSATIALAVIAGIAVVIIVLLVLYIVWSRTADASHHHRQKDRQSGHSAAATETTNAGGSDMAYQELNMTSRSQPVYNELARQ